MKSMFVAIALAALAAGAARAQGRAAPFDSPLAQGRLLSDFPLTRLDGTVVRSGAALPGEGKWLLVYVQANCRPCDRLLSLVKQDDHPELPLRMVIVTGGARDTASGMRDKRVDLAAAQWYADETREAWTALHMAGAPMVFGVRDQTIQWSLSGMLKSDSDVKSILASWAAE